MNSEENLRAKLLKSMRLNGDQTKEQRMLDNTSPPDQSVQPLSSAEARRRFERDFFFVTQKRDVMQNQKPPEAQWLTL